VTAAEVAAALDVVAHRGATTHPPVDGRRWSTGPAPSLEEV